MKRALITGITGQDGSYLAELLLAKGCEVHGLIRRASTFNTGRVDHLYRDPHEPNTRMFLHYGDLSTSEQLTRLIYDLRPDEIYHLGAQSHVKVSFEIPEYTGNIDALGTTRLLEIVRQSGVKTRFYHAGSSEMFGDAPVPQSERTAFCPRSPYAAAKVYGYWMTVNYRRGYDLWACNGILFNHESPRRGATFVTRKVTMGIANILAGKQKTLYLGNLDARRDWGYAPDYIEAMWQILQQDDPDDYVIGTGASHSVKQFVEEAFSYVRLDWRDYTRVDPRYFRPTEVAHLMADATKARERLRWEPKVRFGELVRIMVDADLEAIGLNSPGEGREIVRRKFSEWHRWEAGTTLPRETVATGV